ncbi:hypothetical protein ACFVX6_32795 [Streptomyces sp. NPDC058289]|uniref:ATP-dependent DNA ligase n=1 Tax=Streptomyces sp. NPDC058289 TaxID=3346425 RepID=UPI0036F02B25
MVFDVLQTDGRELLHLPYVERRARLEALFADHALTAPWTLCPMTTDPARAREWLESWTDVSGVEGVLCKPQTSRYMPGHRGRGPRSDDVTPPRRSSAPSPTPSPARSSSSSAATTRTVGCARLDAPSRCARRRPTWSPSTWSLPTPDTLGRASRSLRRGGAVTSWTCVWSAPTWWPRSAPTARSTGAASGATRSASSGCAWTWVLRIFTGSGRARTLQPADRICSRSAGIAGLAAWWCSACASAAHSCSDLRSCWALRG